jgi:Domain of unknown function (DUF4748)
MNTARSVWTGWALLMGAGAAAYYFAKRDINAHRREQEEKGLRHTEFYDCMTPRHNRLRNPLVPAAPR